MIKIYSMKNCGYCNELKTLLDSDNIEYMDVDINKPENKDESDSVFEVAKVESVPIIRIDNQLLVPDVSFTSIEEAFELTKKFMV